MLTAAAANAAARPPCSRARPGPPARFPGRGESWAEFRATLPQGALGWAEAVLPCIRWLRGYRWRQWLVPDVLAGIAATVMTVPEGIANAVRDQDASGGADCGEGVRRAGGA